MVVVVAVGTAVVVVADVGGGVVVVVGAAVVVVAGVVRPVHGVGGPATALVEEDATTVDGTVTVVVGPTPGLPVAGLCRASGCSAIVTPGCSSLSSVSNGVVSLTLVACGSPNTGPPAWSSCAASNVVSAIRPANAAMGAIMTAAKHPRPLAGSSR